MRKQIEDKFHKLLALSRSKLDNWKKKSKLSESSSNNDTTLLAPTQIKTEHFDMVSDMDLQLQTNFIEKAPSTGSVNLNEK